jgi:hypothetical protein
MVTEIVLLTTVTISQPEIAVSVSGIATNATCLIKLMVRLLQQTVKVQRL